MPVPITPAQLAAIIRRREQLGLSQHDLAVACGVQRQQINRIERGVRYPSEKLLASMAAALGLKLDVKVTLK
jgi:transcriptional regulator with XRE-family HTH domain